MLDFCTTILVYPLKQYVNTASNLRQLKQFHIFNFQVTRGLYSVLILSSCSLIWPLKGFNLPLFPVFRTQLFGGRGGEVGGACSRIQPLQYCV
jgi:hypothetical protein